MNDDSQTPAGALGRCAVLLPVWQPEEGLERLVSELAAEGFGAVVLVDDGSDARHGALFARLSLLPRVSVLRHAVNLGKGRALKTGINHVLCALPLINGLVTADGDGQHRVADIARVARALAEANGAVVLGSRSFGREVPLRSRFGNLLTRIVFGFITGAILRDTQTGLRAFPRELLPELMTLDGERYEYEMTVLAHVCHSHKPVEVAIETVYLQGNRASHFDPIWDSMRIYFVLVRFYFSAILSAGIDFVGFTATYALTGNVLASVVVGRLSSLVNFALNKRFVFHNAASLAGSLWRYYALAATLGAICYVLISSLAQYAHWNVFAAKLVVETLLSLVSFSVQRTFVFPRGDSVVRSR
jgi:glycosyltransferase involved in cell wall biosynthesis